MTLELDRAFQNAAVDDKVKVIILRGEGTSFSSGHDLGTPEQNADPVWNTLSTTGMRGNYEKWSVLDTEACLRWRSIRKPVICAAKGFVVYHAYAVMSIADIVVAADDLKIMPSLTQFPSVTWDLALNPRKAKEIYMMQRFVLADEAEELGLVQRVVPKAKLDEECVRLARVLGKSDAFHLRMMKGSVNQSQDAAGYTTNMRNNLSHMASSIYSRQNDPTSSMVMAMKAGTWDVKKLAPIPVASAPEMMYWSETAARKNRGMRGAKM